MEGERGARIVDDNWDHKRQVVREKGGCIFESDPLGKRKRTSGRRHRRDSSASATSCMAMNEKVGFEALELRPLSWSALIQLLSGETNGPKSVGAPERNIERGPKVLGFWALR